MHPKYRYSVNIAITKYMQKYPNLPDNTICKLLVTTWDQTFQRTRNDVLSRKTPQKKKQKFQISDAQNKRKIKIIN